jgi:ketosteroid isomerase-like protein
MMSEKENVETVKQFFGAAARGDVQLGLNLLSEDIEIHHPVPKTIWPFAGKRKGKDQVVEFYMGTGETVDFEQFEPQEYIAQNDKVVVLMFERFCIKATGKYVDNEYVMVFTLMDGQIVQWRIYEDTAPIIKAINGD